MFALVPYVVRDSGSAGGVQGNGYLVSLTDCSLCFSRDGYHRQRIYGDCEFVRDGCTAIGIGHSDFIIILCADRILFSGGSVTPCIIVGGSSGTCNHSFQRVNHTGADFTVFILVGDVYGRQPVYFDGAVDRVAGATVVARCNDHIVFGGNFCRSTADFSSFHTKADSCREGVVDSCKLAILNREGDCFHCSIQTQIRICVAAYGQLHGIVHNNGAGDGLSCAGSVTGGSVGVFVSIGSSRGTGNTGVVSCHSGRSSIITPGEFASAICYIESDIVDGLSKADSLGGIASHSQLHRVVHDDGAGEEFVRADTSVVAVSIDSIRNCTRVRGCSGDDTIAIGETVMAAPADGKGTVVTVNNDVFNRIAQADGLVAFCTRGESNFYCIIHCNGAVDALVRVTATVV